MTSIINNQPVTVQQLIVPEGTGLHNNTSPSLNPTQGSLAWDDSGTPGVIYSGTGLAWIGLNNGDVIGPSLSAIGDIPYFTTLDGKTIADSGILYTDVVKASTTSVSSNLVSYNGTGGRVVQDSGILSTNVVQGPASVTSGDVVSFNGTTGKLIADSGKVAANLVTGPVSAVNTNLASFNGTTGKILQDSGISAISTTVSPLTMTSGAANPSLTGGLLYLQKITIGALSVVYWEVAFLNTITATTPDTWAVAATIPSGYIPPFNETFPALITNNTDSSYVTGCFTMNQNTALSLTILTSLTGKSLAFNNFSGIYRVV